jgi:hypothetical protein
VYTNQPTIHPTFGAFPGASFFSFFPWIKRGKKVAFYNPKGNAFYLGW